MSRKELSDPRLEELEAENASLISKNEELRHRVVQLTAANDQLRQAAGTLGTVVPVMHGANLALVEKTRKLEQEMAERRFRALEESFTIERQLEATRNELLTNDIKRLSQENEALRSANAQLTLECERLKGDSGALQSRVAALEEKDKVLDAKEARSSALITFSTMFDLANKKDPALNKRCQEVQQAMQEQLFERLNDFSPDDVVAVQTVAERHHVAHGGFLFRGKPEIKKFLQDFTMPKALAADEQKVLLQLYQFCYAKFCVDSPLEPK